ncbi:hypothetical protein CB1_001471003 [Camelus ferus]|nr:hypothetical protein CB1_001471003 [Camelus ferus]
MAVALGCAIQASLNQGSVFQEYDTDCEVFRQRFRQFQYKEAAGPHEAFNKLWELCCQWLKPKMRSKEQILELLVLEQFLTILPTEIETWIERQEMLLEELAPVGMAPIPPNIHLESPPLQVMGPAPEVPVAEAWIPQAGPQELSFGAAGEGQPFLDPGYPIPKLDVSFPLEHREEAWVKELQESKEIKQLLDSKLGFEIGIENEEDTSEKQKKLEDMSWLGEKAQLHSRTEDRRQGATCAQLLGSGIAPKGQQAHHIHPFQSVITDQMTVPVAEGLSNTTPQPGLSDVVQGSRHEMAVLHQHRDVVQGSCHEMAVLHQHRPASRWRVEHSASFGRIRFLQMNKPRG